MIPLFTRQPSARKRVDFEVPCADGFWSAPETSTMWTGRLTHNEDIPSKYLSINLCLSTYHVVPPKGCPTAVQGLLWMLSQVGRYIDVNVHYLPSKASFPGPHRSWSCMQLKTVLAWERERLKSACMNSSTSSAALCLSSCLQWNRCVSSTPPCPRVLRYVWN